MANTVLQMNSGQEKYADKRDKLKQQTMKLSIKSQDWLWEMIETKESGAGKKKKDAYMKANSDENRGFLYLSLV